MRNLYSKDVSKSVVDNLESGTTVSVKITANQISGTGVLKRGTLLSTADGEEYTVYDTTADISCILVTDVDADDPDESKEVAVYSSGEFNQNVIEEVMGFALTPLAIENARARQIYIAPQNPAPVYI